MPLPFKKTIKQTLKQQNKSASIVHSLHLFTKVLMVRTIDWYRVFANLGEKLSNYPYDKSKLQFITIA